MIPQLWIRLLGAGICLVLLFFFVAPMLVGIRNAGCYFGTVVSLVGMVFFLANSKVAQLLQKGWENETVHVLLCILFGLLVLGVILAIAVSCGMVKAMHTSPQEEVPVIVLGCKVRNDGPSLMLLHRLEAAETYLKAHPEVPAILCGGQGSDEPMSEAQSMYDYLTAHGIAAERLYKEEQSVSTFENLRNAKEILDKQELGGKVTIVTDGYHQLRSAMNADSVGLQATAVSAKTSWYLVPTYWVREWMGVCYQFIFG